MPTYKIRIQKYTPNPNLEEEKKDILGGGYGNRNRYEAMPEPREEIVKDILVVELTEQEYKKVKLEIIKVFE